MGAVYTVADVAMMLGISDETVRRGAADGWIPAVRVSASKYVFPRAAADVLDSLIGGDESQLDGQKP